MTEIVVALVGTHEYEWAVWIFATLFKKYWGEGIITYVGDRQEGELPANVQFYRVPCYSEGVWVWAHWFGNGLNSFFERCGDTPVLLFLPDQWLKEPVWHEGIYSLARYMRGKPDIIRGNVTADVRLYGYGSHVDTWEEWEIWQTSVDSPHASLDGGLTFCPSLWNPRLAREIIEPHWTLHNCEIMGTQKMQTTRRDLRTVGIFPPPIHRAHGLHRDQKETVNLLNVLDVDRPVVRQYVPPVWKVIE